jgi:hypothetical protein
VLRSGVGWDLRSGLLWDGKVGQGVQRGRARICDGRGLGRDRALLERSRLRRRAGPAMGNDRPHV